MTSRIQKQLPMLMALARDHKNDSRLQLADLLANLFLANDEVLLSPREEDLVNELIDLLLKNTSALVRHTLIKRFAEATRMPRNVALRLSCAPIDVARAILLTNESLTDEDLITVVETQTRDHACAIAGRQNISEAVADALVVTGDLRVMQVVAENFGAKLSPHAMGILAESARLTESLQMPVMNRRELTAKMATSLYWWVSQDLRRIVLGRFGVSAGQLDEALAAAIEEKLEGHLLEKQDDAAMIDVALWLQNRKALNAQTLLQLLRLGHFRLFNISLGLMSKLELHLVDIIVSSVGGRLLAVLCRSIDIDKANFISIFLLSRGARPGEQIVHPSELSSALSAYDNLNKNLAQTIMADWHKDPSYLFSHAEDPALQEVS